MGNFERLILRVWLVISLVTLSWLFYKETSRSAISIFETIEAKRINIRESDGTLRLAISNTDEQDVGNIDGISIHEPGKRPAGMIFFNELGDEMGGLIFGGKSKTGAGGSFTFDRWKNDQTIQILYSDSEGGHTSGIIVSDRPNDDTMVSLLKRQMEIKNLEGEEKSKAEAQLMDDIKNKKINLGTTRAFAGLKNGVAQYALYDVNGKLKVRISAESDGPGKIELFDKDGNPVSIR